MYKLPKNIVRFFSILLCTILLSSMICIPQKAHAFDKAAAKKKISVTYKKLSDGVLAIYKNKNSTPVKLTTAIRFLDSEKKTIATVKKYNYCLEAKGSCALFFQAPRDTVGNVINYSSYKGSFSAGKSKHKSSSSKIAVSFDLQTIYANFSAMNMSGRTLENIHATIVFYDSNKKIIGCKEKYLNCYKKKEIGLFTIDYEPRWALPASAKVYVNWAY